MFNNSIKQRLKVLEILNNKDKQHHLRPIILFITEPNKDIFKLDMQLHNNKDYFINIKDADKLEFKTEQECKEWLDTNRDLINLPNDYTDNDRLKMRPMLIKIVDNSHLERFMYECNR